MCKKRILRNLFVVDNGSHVLNLSADKASQGGNGCYQSCNRRTNQFGESQQQPQKNVPFSITQTQQIA